MTNSTLAVLGGDPVRSRSWPKWPKAAQAEYDVLGDVLESGRWALSGSYKGTVCYERKFARDFAGFHGVPYCTPVSSGTAALTVALQAVGVGQGDEVLVPGLTWVACASVVANLGAVPVLVDVKPRTLAMDPELARAACTDRTAAILLVHLFCTLADLDAFTALSRDLGIPVIEDCSQAHGARWRDKPVGTFGAAGCFSMQQSKLLTSGEGGAAITSDARLYDLMEQLRCDGRRFVSNPQVGRLELEEVGTVHGRNLCLSEFQAALLVTGLRRLEAENKVREKRARELESLLEDVDGVSPLPRDPRVTARTFYNYVLRLDLEAFGGVSVDVISRALTAELQTTVNPVYVPLHRHRLLRSAGLSASGSAAADHAAGNPLAEAEDARRTCLTLPHPVLLGEEADMADIMVALLKVQDCAKELLDTAPERAAWAF